MHKNRARKTNGLPCQAFDTCPECEVFAFDLLRLLFPHRVRAWIKIRVSKTAILGPNSLTGFWIQEVKAVSLMPGGPALSGKCSPPGLGNGGPEYSS